MKLLPIAMANMRHQKKRTLLTIIGIFVGIAAVVALVSLGQGLQYSIEDRFAQIGADKLFIMPAGQFGGVGGGDLTNPLTNKDVDFVSSIKGVKESTGLTYRSTNVRTGKGESGFYMVWGLPTDNQWAYDLVIEGSTLKLLDGRHLRSGDRNVAIIGFDYQRDDVFDNSKGIGDRIEINNETFSIVGIWEALGNAVDDRSVAIPANRMESLLDTNDEVDMAYVRVDQNADIIAVAANVERELLDFRDLDEDEQDFTVQSPEDILKSFNTILLIIQVVLIGISLISLLVGGIGIMNTMYTAVLERTKEIGIMKAVGATPKQIQTIFLFESGLLGLVGGIIGVVIGLSLSKGVEAAGKIALNTDLLHAYVSVWLIVGALFFSVVVGMISGYLPARTAAAQDPVESLRYE